MATHSSPTKPAPSGELVSKNGQIVTDVCIIGTGPAGITAAWELQQQGFHVTMVEGSRAPKSIRTNKDYYEENWANKPYLYGGVACGLFSTNEPEFLIRPGYDYFVEDPPIPRSYTNDPPWERERVFGGTGSHWGGQARPLDPIVFERRQAADGTYAFPGWPIGPEDLASAYAAAAPLYGLTNNFDTDYWAGQYRQLTNRSLDLFTPSGFDIEMYQFVPGNRHDAAKDTQSPARRDFTGTDSASGQKVSKPIDQWVDVIQNATLTDVVVQGGKVDHIELSAMSDRTNPPTIPSIVNTFKIKAEYYILACGAVANARQLLLYNIGNEYDKVGRYFMCHPLSRNGIITTTNTPLGQGQYTNQLSFMSGWDDAQGVNVQGRFIPDAATARDNKIGRCWFWANSKYQTSQYYFEMTPNENSRVQLTDPGTVDPVFHQRQTHIHWELSSVNDKATYDITRQKMIDGGIQVDAPTWDQVMSSYEFVVNGHHIGTTRMSEEPEDGVVDKNLRVHSVKNLYVAGSSVFPTTGISNPTFTIIALSIRLANHIKSLRDG